MLSDLNFLAFCFLHHFSMSKHFYLCRCVPSLFSIEMGVIFAQGCLLVSRTFISDAISKIEARAGRYLIAQVGYFKCTTLSSWLPDCTDKQCCTTFVRGEAALCLFNCSSNSLCPSQPGYDFSQTLSFCEIYVPCSFCGVTGLGNS